MHVKVKINVVFLLLKIVASDPLNYGFGNYRRDEQELQNAATNPEENVQKLSGFPDYVDQNHQTINVASEVMNEGNDVNNEQSPTDSPLENGPAPLQFSNKNSAMPSAQAQPIQVNLYKVSNAQEITGHRWPMGVVPYFIDQEVYDSTTVKRIVKQMAVIETFSCVIFRELTKKPEESNEDWLYFTNPRNERECVHEFSHNSDGGTDVILGFDCLHPEEVLHSLFHAIGFHDEVSHPNRDLSIRIMWDNIQPKYRHLFRIRFDDIPFKLVDYDPRSIMQFHDQAFSANGGLTITSLVPGLQIGGRVENLSQLDIMKLKLAFSHECNKRKIGDLLNTCKNSLYPHKNGDRPNRDEAEGEENTNDEHENLNQEVPIEDIKKGENENKEATENKQENEEHSNEDVNKDNENKEEKKTEHPDEDVKEVNGDQEQKEDESLAEGIEEKPDSKEVHNGDGNEAAPIDAPAEDEKRIPNKFKSYNGKTMIV